MKNFTKLFRFLKPYKKWAVLAPLLVILEIMVDLFLPSIMANIVNVGIKESDINYIILNIIIMIIITIIAMIGGIGSSYYASKASQYSDADIRSSILSKINSLSFLNLDKIKPGHLITIITNDITLIGTVFMYGLRFIVRVPIVIIGSIIMAIIISPKLSTILIVVVPIMIIITTYIMKKVFPLFNTLQESVDDVNAVVRENLGGIRVVKAFTNESYEKDKFDQVNTNLKNNTIKAVTTLAITMPLIMLLINIATVLVLWIGGIDVINNNLEIGNIIAFIQYLTNILTSILMASMVIIMVARSEASAYRINEIFNMKEDFENTDKFKNTNNIKGNVEFKNVSFSYEMGSGDNTLTDISFKAQPGELIVFIGSTGSGKSTLISLISRFYDPTKGEILIDNENIKNYKVDELRSKIGFAFQKPFLFSQSIKNNIKYGLPSASDEEVIKASTVACVNEYINSKENGYDYMLEERGVNLSGGQKQRLAIARAILPNPPIIILDDVTSAVDMKTEKTIHQNMKKHFKNSTILMVASRISMAIEADKVIVIEDGKIVGIGKHKELLKNNAIYQDIYYSQVKDGE